MLKLRMCALLLAMVLALTALPAAIGEGLDDPDLLPEALDGASGAVETPDAPLSIVEYVEPQSRSVDTGSADNDALFAGYVDRQFALRGNRRDRANAIIGTQLTGVDAIVYRALAAGITEVASGARSSTTFELSGEELGYTKLSWTAEELGVSDIVVDGKISADAKAAANAQYAACDVNLLIDILMADYPYEMFWFDKTEGYQYAGPALAYAASYSGGSWTLTVTTGYTFELSVASEYAGTEEFTTDSDRIASVQTAVNNAKAVVSNNASKSDYDKLVAYRQYICGAVSYNHDAAANDSTPYGNPWQMIWVFDGDSSTNVVCEGYSKAFQYLCDVTKFSGDVYCYTVSGTMTGGTGAGRHMWNVVSMQNGKRYLVDVTNCDSGTIGADDQLFMVGYNSGSVSGGYSIQCNGGSISYVYNSDTLGTFPESLLTLSDKSYLEDDATNVHEWNDPEYEWSDDNLTVTATRVCKCGADHIETETVAATMALSKGPTETAKGETLFTAAFANEAFGTVTKAAADIPALKDLSVLRLPAALKEIDDEAFRGLTVQSIIITDGCTKIGSKAFADCPNLIYIRIPASVTSIEGDAFEGSDQVRIDRGE